LTGNVAAARIATALETSSFAAANLTGRVPAANANLGAVLQVVQSYKIDSFSSTSGTWADVTGLSASITPTSLSSKILVIADVAMGSSDLNGFNFVFRIVRDSTPIGVSNFATVNASGGINMFLSNGAVPFAFGNMKMFLDSPSVASSITYKIQINKDDVNGTLWVNRRASATDFGGTSGITLMEIAA